MILATSPKVLVDIEEVEGEPQLVVNGKEYDVTNCRGYDLRVRVGEIIEVRMYYHPSVKPIEIKYPEREKE